MTGPAILTITGLAIAAGIAAWGVITLAWAIVDAVTAAARSYRRQLALEDLDIAAGRTQAHQRCNRCRTGSAAFPCTCDTDCYEEICAGWYRDDRRDVLRGDT